MTSPTHHNIVTKFRELLSQKEMKWEAVVEFFTRNAYNALTPASLRHTPEENRVLMIKYLDHNRIWDDWSRDCRGVILWHRTPSTLDVVPIKYMMPRGTEVVTGMHAKFGVDGEVDVGGKFGIKELAPSQRGLIDMFRDVTTPSALPQPAYVSFKRDGSLLSVTVFRDPVLARYIADCVEKYGDAYAKACLALSRFAETGKVVMLSSQSTLFAPDFMLPYYTTAVVVGSGVITDAALDDVVRNQGLKPHEVLTQYGAEFFRRVMTFEATEPTHADGLSCTYSMEAVCRARQTAWGDVHRDLTVSYRSSFTSWLSRAVCYDNHIVFEPHFKVPSLQSLSLFPEPMYWEVGTTRDVEVRLLALDDVVFGKITPQQFLERFPPLGGMRHDAMDEYLDYEGFILYTGPNNEYNKVKSNLYYKCHKLSFRDMPELKEVLCQSTVARQVFPQTNKVYTFFHSGKVEEWVVSFKALMEAELENQSGELAASLPSKALNGFWGRPVDVRHRMLLRGPGGAVAGRMVRQHFRTSSIMPPLLVDEAFRGYSEAEVTEVLISVAEQVCFKHSAEDVLGRMRTCDVPPSTASSEDGVAHVLHRLFLLCMGWKP